MKARPEISESVRGTWVALALVLVQLPCAAGGADFTGGSFLPLGHGARSFALGGSGIALIRDDAASYWNPANLAWLQRSTSITLMHADILPVIADGYQTASFARASAERLGETSQELRPTRWGYGLFVSHMGFDFDSGNSWGENLIQLGGAFALNNFTSLGVGLKLLRLTNDFESANATGGGMDLGLSVLVYDELTVAIVGHDVWTRVSWETSTWETLEPAWTLGFEYRVLESLASELDLIVREKTIYRTNLGVEWRAYRDVLWLRGGLTILDAGEKRTFPSSGVGVQFSHFMLDYGAAFDDEDALEIGQRVSLRISF